MSNGVTKMEKQHESKHYVFHYNGNSSAERDLSLIVQQQEACFEFICNILQVRPNFKLHYFLCDTPEEVGHIYGDDDPCNGFASPPDKIYAVYNDKVKCIGFHEDAHLISYTINRPESPAVREGLAMYFDRKWWGIHNQDWAGFFLRTGRYQPVYKLLDRDYFFSFDCSVTYPIMGAFTDYLICSFGINMYLAFYASNEKAPEALLHVYHKTPEELDSAFVAYIRLFRTDEAVEKRMEILLGVDDIP